jgi:hypothetical protein
VNVEQLGIGINIHRQTNVAVPHADQQQGRTARVTKGRSDKGPPQVGYRCLPTPHIGGAPHHKTEQSDDFKIPFCAIRKGRA